jgi:uncharacterized membrane protein YsdA (DUF1294 family)
MTMELTIIWLLVINIITVILMARDKHLARIGARRVSEATLLGWMTLGGAPGGLIVARIIRHKTRKQPFAWTMNILCLTWVVVIGLELLDYLDPLVERALAIIRTLA